MVDPNLPMEVNGFPVELVNAYDNEITVRLPKGCVRGPDAAPLGYSMTLWYSADTGIMGGFEESPWRRYLLVNTIADPTEMEFDF